MNRCDFCYLNRPNAMIFKCGYNFTITYSKTGICKEAQAKYERYLREKESSNKVPT